MPFNHTQYMKEISASALTDGRVTSLVLSNFLVLAVTRGRYFLTFDFKSKRGNYWNTGTSHLEKIQLFGDRVFSLVEGQLSQWAIPSIVEPSHHTEQVTDFEVCYPTCTFTNLMRTPHTPGQVDLSRHNPNRLPMSSWSMWFNLLITWFYTVLQVSVSSRWNLYIRRKVLRRLQTDFRDT
ncbi:hypothetical protein CPB83DRAFT_627610 [Crepidotus variabilis]|uniref:Uncharacterized protein n=1 Tax=Crepidotus variabilis TaxID=179855 RepID=A0A9P6EPZ7_9AGAR|nr:hypothetical protein CPB83DRAFT_627610 [Crepidotus variabilis]